MDDLLADVARRQHGTFSHAQALAYGETEATIRTALGRGRWERVLPLVYQPAGTRLGVLSRHWAVYLAIGAPMAFTGSSAAVLWHLDVPTPARCVIVLPSHRRTSRLPGLLQTRSRADIAQIRWRGGLPAVPVEVCVRALAAELPALAYAPLVADLLRAGRTTPDRLAAACGRGRPGSRSLGEVLRLLADGHQSRWERRLAAALVRAGLPSPEVQFAIWHGGRVIAYADLAYPSARLLVEVDGFVVHSRAREFEDDRVRQNMLVGLGYRVLRYTPHQIQTALPAVVAEIAAFLRAA